MRSRLILLMVLFTVVACDKRSRCDAWRHNSGHCAVTPFLLNTQLESYENMKVFVDGPIARSLEGDIFVYGSVDQAQNGAVMDRVQLELNGFPIEFESLYGMRVFGIAESRAGKPYIRMTMPTQPRGRDDSFINYNDWLVDQKIVISIAYSDLNDAAHEFWDNNADDRNCLRGMLVESLLRLDRSKRSRDIFEIEVSCRNNGHRYHAYVDLRDRSVQWARM